MQLLVILITFFLSQSAFSQTCLIGAPELKLNGNRGESTQKRTAPVGDPLYSEIARATGGMVMAGKPSEIADNMKISLAHERHPDQTILVSDRFTMGMTPYVQMFSVDSDGELSIVVSVMEHDGLRVAAIRPDNQEVTKGLRKTKIFSTAAGCLITVRKPPPGMWSLRLEGTGEVKLSVYSTAPRNEYQVPLE